METIQSNLVADVITEIFENLSVRDLLSALLVNQEWCQIAVPMYWKAPFSYTKKRSIAALKIYELFFERGSSTLLGTKENSARGAVQETPVLYDYPLFLKELNYTNLLALGERVEAILQMLTNRGIRLNTFVMDNTGANNEAFYGIWTAPCYAPIFNSLIHVEIHTPFSKNNVMKTLAKNCTRLSHLDINLYDNAPDRVKETLDYLEKLFSVQQCRLNLRLVFPNGPGKMLINTFQSQLESFKRLELVKWDFNGCEWRWLKMCPNLTEFAITSPPQTGVSDTLGSIYETYLLKPSKNSKIRTAHWHFDKDDDGISSMSNFYFHQDKPSMEPYDDKPPFLKRR
ncbi:6918_t:CDS:2 [Ambispora gerdemannii]|uniref:6918_t:CDS:1 n=1 Tax=Ambispora gerdemannii TaxID=144530 RepID=A0A9N9FBZ7_9GLOM|nr:6918_t:CDS:2 [Ambispora gerdemannii]